MFYLDKYEVCFQVWVFNIIGGSTAFVIICFIFTFTEFCVCEGFGSLSYRPQDPCTVHLLLNVQIDLDVVILSLSAKQCQMWVHE